MLIALVAKEDDAPRYDTSKQMRKNLPHLKNKSEIYNSYYIIYIILHTHLRIGYSLYIYIYIHKKASTSNDVEALIYTKSDYAPKLSNKMFSEGTPRLSSILTTADAIIGGPHIR